MRRFLTFASVLAFVPAALRAQAPLYDVSGQAGENQGWGLSALGDVNNDGAQDFLAGAPTGTGLAANSGLVRVYSGKTALPLLTLKGEIAGDQFGYSVAGLGDLDGDGEPEIAVGAPGHDTPIGTDRGAVYVFSSVTGAQLAKHVGLFDEDRIGWRVAGIGDVNLDGVPDYAIGAPYADSILLGTNIGFVYVHSGANHAQLRVYWGANAQDLFGYDVDSAGDLNGDGRADLVVGAPGFAVGGNGSAGAGYALSGQADQTVLFKINGTANGEFAFDVAGVSDVTGDGVDELAFGEPGHDTPGVDAGRLRVYDGVTKALVRDFVGMTGDRLGWSVDGLDDFDGDGRGDVVVGLPFADNPPLVDVGLVRVFSVQTGLILTGWSGYLSGDYMGWVVTSAGDVNQDGWNDPLGAAPFSDLNFPDSGRLRIHLGNAFLPEGYCTAKTNSSGCVPQLTYGGCASATLGNGIQLVALNVLPGMVGIMIWSQQPQALPFMGGTLCVAPPIIRTGAQAAAPSTGWPCLGQYSFLFGPAYMQANGLSVGDDIYTQYWSRDLGFAPPNNVGLTAGLHFRIVP